MNKIAIIVIIFGLFIAFPVWAEPKIDTFVSMLEVKPSGFIDVTEMIDYDFGPAEKHGIFRDIPISYGTEKGEREVKLSDIYVTDPAGSVIKHELIHQTGKKRLKIGDPNATVKGKVVYVIHYTVSGAIDFTDDKDGFEWNVTGGDWTIPMNKVNASIILPRQLPKEEISKNCHMGPPGNLADCVKSDFAMDGNLVKSVEFESGKIEAGSSMVVGIRFPKDIVAGSIDYEKIASAVRHNALAGLPLAVAAVLWLIRSRFAGKGNAGASAVVSDPPGGMPPSVLAYFYGGQGGRISIAADLIRMAVNGRLKIRKVSDDPEYSIAVKNNLNGPADSVEKLVLDIISSLDSASLEEGGGISLSKIKAHAGEREDDFRRAIEAHLKSMGLEAGPAEKSRKTLLIIGVLMAGSAIFLIEYSSTLVILSIMFSGIMVVLFGIFFPINTGKESEMKNKIAAFRNFLAEPNDAFASLPPDTDLFERNIAYALVLGVGDSWARSFKGIYKEAPVWYSDSKTDSFNIDIFMEDLKKITFS